MNLAAIAGPLIEAVNPSITGTLGASTGSATAADGSRVPTYRYFPNIRLQVQALSAGDLIHLDGLNIQGVLRAVYFNGVLKGLDRLAGRGGDILEFYGADWLVAAVLEPWDGAGWVKVAVTQQSP